MRTFFSIYNFEINLKIVDNSNGFCPLCSNQETTKADLAKMVSLAIK